MERAGRDARLEEFCRQEYAGLVRILSVYCGDRDTAEDLAQETLARVWRRWERVRDMDRPELWARRVALNLASTWRRHERLVRARGMTPAAPIPAPDAAVGEADLARALAGLSSRQRAVLVLRFYEDRSVAETAQLLGVRQGTVRALSAQALARIRADRAAIEELGQ